MGKGRERSRVGEEKMGCNTVPGTWSAHPMGSSEARMVFQSCPESGSQALVSHNNQSLEAGRLVKGL